MREQEGVAAPSTLSYGEIGVRSAFYIELFLQVHLPLLTFLSYEETFSPL